MGRAYSLGRDDQAPLEELRAQLETTELISLAEDDLRDGSLFVAAIRSRISDHAFISRMRLALADRRSAVPLHKHSNQKLSRWAWANAAASVLACCVSFVSLLALKVASDCSDHQTEWLVTVDWRRRSGSDGGRTLTAVNGFTSMIRACSQQDSRRAFA